MLYQICLYRYWYCFVQHLLALHHAAKLPKKVLVSLCQTSTPKSYYGVYGRCDGSFLHTNSRWQTDLICYVSKK